MDLFDSAGFPDFLICSLIELNPKCDSDSEKPPPFAPNYTCPPCFPCTTVVHRPSWEHTYKVGKHCNQVYPSHRFLMRAYPYMSPLSLRETWGTKCRNPHLGGPVVQQSKLISFHQNLTARVGLHTHSVCVPSYCVLAPPFLSGRSPSLKTEAGRLCGPTSPPAFPQTVAMCDALDISSAQAWHKRSAVEQTVTLAEDALGSASGSSPICDHPKVDPKEPRGGPGPLVIDSAVLMGRNYEVQSLPQNQQQMTFVDASEQRARDALWHDVITKAQTILRENANRELTVPQMYEQLCNTNIRAVRFLGDEFTLNALLGRLNESKAINLVTGCVRRWQRSEMNWQN